MITHEDGAYSVRLPAMTSLERQLCKSAHGWCYMKFGDPDRGLWVWGPDLKTEVFGFRSMEDAVEFQMIWL